jgi:Phosphotransferase enzyme family
MDAAEICDAFGLGRPIGLPSYIARGELGRVSRLVATSGVWAVKEIDLFVPTVAEADANVEFQESMLAAGVTLPRPRRTVDGHGLYGNVRVYEWLDLTPIPAGGATMDADAMVAASLARLHQLAPSTDAAPEPWYCDAPSRDQWAALLAEASGEWWAPVIAARRTELTDLARPHHTPAHLCHLDVCPENTFLCDGRLTIIDWENAGPAATVQDLGSTLWDFCQGERRRTQAFVEHYREHGGPIERLDASVFDTARIVQANLVDFQCRRVLNPAAPHEARERAEQALRALLGRLLTRQVVDDVVASDRP